MNVLSEVEDIRVALTRATAECSVLRNKLEAQQQIVSDAERRAQEVASWCCREGILQAVKDHTITVKDACSIWDTEAIQKTVHTCVPRAICPEVSGSSGDFEFFNTLDTWICGYDTVLSECNPTPAFRVRSGDFEILWDYCMPVYPMCMHVHACGTEAGAHFTGTLLILGEHHGAWVLLSEHVFQDASCAHINIGGGCYVRYAVRGNGWMHTGWMAQLQFDVV